MGAFDRGAFDREACDCIPVKLAFYLQIYAAKRLMANVDVCRRVDVLRRSQLSQPMAQHTASHELDVMATCTTR